MSRNAKYAALVLGLGALACLVYLLLDWRQQAVVQRPMLPVAFEHIDHNEEPCADCHHNFVDDTGGGACYNCHKLTPELAPEMEDMFHQFCRDCHVQKRVLHQDSGPLRECSGCHQ